MRRPPIVGAGNGTSGLEPFRRRLDRLDEEIVRALGERFEVCREIALHKREHGIAMMQPGRVEVVHSRYLAHGAEVDLPEQFTSQLFELLIAATCTMEDELIDAAGGPGDERPRSTAPAVAQGRER